jgi:hypothetical protein
MASFAGASGTHVDLGIAGLDSFTYRVSDALISNVAVVNLNVSTATRQPPEAVRLRAGGGGARHPELALLPGVLGPRGGAGPRLNEQVRAAVPPRSLRIERWAVIDDADALAFNDPPARCDDSSQSSGTRKAAAAVVWPW